MLISSLYFYYIFSPHNVPSFRACCSLLASLSGYQYTRRAWKKDVMELLLDPSFFQMDISCIGSWRTIIDNLMTQDNTSFKELMARVAGLSQSASINIFANREQVRFFENFVRIQSILTNGALIPGVRFSNGSVTFRARNQYSNRNTKNYGASTLFSQLAKPATRDRELYPTLKTGPLMILASSVYVVY